MSEEELYDMHVQLIEEQKKLIQLNFLFPVYERKNRPHWTRFILDPSEVQEQILLDHKFKLKNWSLLQWKTIVSTYLNWVEFLYFLVHEQFRVDILKHWTREKHDLLWTDTERNALYEWTDIYVRSCLSRFWTKDADPVFQTQYQSSTESFAAQIPEDMKAEYQQFQASASPELYPLLLSVQIQPHLILQNFALNKRVVMHHKHHIATNAEYVGNPCFIVIPSIQIDFTDKTKAYVLVEQDVQPTACTLPSWCGSIGSTQTMTGRRAKDADVNFERFHLEQKRQLDVRGKGDQHPDEETCIRQVIDEIQREISMVKAQSQRLATLFEGYPTQKPGRFIPSHQEIPQLLHTFQTQYPFTSNQDKLLLQLYVTIISEFCNRVIDSYVQKIMQEIWNPYKWTHKTWLYDSDRRDVTDWTTMYVKRVLLQIWTSEFDAQWQHDRESIFEKHKSLCHAQNGSCDEEMEKQLDVLHELAHTSLYRLLIFTNIFSPPLHKSTFYTGTELAYNPALHISVNPTPSNNDTQNVTILCTFCVDPHTTCNQSLVFTHVVNHHTPLPVDPLTIVEMCSCQKIF